MGEVVSGSGTGSGPGVGSKLEMSMMKTTVYAGTFIQCRTLTDLEIWEDTVVVVGGSGRWEGKILRIEKAGEEGLEKFIERICGELLGEGEVVARRTGEGEFYFPGFIGLWTFLALQSDLFYRSLGQFTNESNSDMLNCSYSLSLLYLVSKSLSFQKKNLVYSRG